MSSAPSPRDELDLSFNSPKDAFKSKKTSELVRAYLVYQICSINWLVENNDMVSADPELRKMSNRWCTVHVSADWLGCMRRLQLRPGVNKKRDFARPIHHLRRLGIPVS